MTATYDSISTTTVSGTTTTSVTFSSISSNYTDLYIVGQCGISTTDYLTFRVGNGSVNTGSNYSYTYLETSGSTLASSRSTGLSKFYLGSDRTICNNTLDYSFYINLMNYSNTTTNKSFSGRVSNLNSSFPGTSISLGLYRSTSAINIVTIAPDTSDGRYFIAGSTFTLYGIKAE